MRHFMVFYRVPATDGTGRVPASTPRLTPAVFDKWEREIAQLKDDAVVITGVIELDGEKP